MSENKIKEIEKLMRDGEMLKVRSEDRISNLTTQYKSKAEELKKLGINVKTAQADLEAKKKERDEKLAKVMELIPEDVIEKYKNYDFSGSKDFDFDACM